MIYIEIRGPRRKAEAATGTDAASRQPAAARPPVQNGGVVDFINSSRPQGEVALIWTHIGLAPDSITLLAWSF